MASGRFISSTLGASHKFEAVGNHEHRLMYVLMVTNADVEGRLTGDPRILNGQAFTLMDWTNAEVETGLMNLARVELIRYYRAKGKAVVEIVDFAKHNKVRKDRERASNLPGPDDDGSEPVTATTTPAHSREDARIHAGGLPEDASDNAAEVKLSEVQIKTKKPPLPPLEIAAPEDEEEPQDLTPYQKAQLAKPQTNHHLPSFFPAAFKALVEFRNVQSNVTDGQFAAWSGAVEDDCRALGEPRVVEVLEATTLASNTLDKPFVYYRKVVKSTPRVDGKPQREWAVDFFAQRRSDGEVEQIDELLAGNQARMSNGEVWDLTGCDLCNN